MFLKIVLATKNKGKIDEINYILKESGIADAIEILSLSDFPDIPEIVEDGKTFSENARKKAEAVAGYTGLTVIADDSGLEVDALNGAPGIYSARFAGEKATDSENIQKLLTLLEGEPIEKRGARFVCAIAVATHRVAPPSLPPLLPPPSNGGEEFGRNIIAALPQGEGKLEEQSWGEGTTFIPSPLRGEGQGGGELRKSMTANVTLMQGECRGLIATEEHGTSGFGYDPVFIVPEYGKTFAELGAEIKNKISHRAVALNKLKTHLKQII